MTQFGKNVTQMNPVINNVLRTGYVYGGIIKKID